MLGGGEELGGGGLFDETAFTEDEDLAGHVLNDGEVMGNEEEGEVGLGAEFAEEVEEACLDGDIEGANRFVADEDLRLDGEGAGEEDALALAAAQFGREAVDGLAGQVDLVEELEDALALLGAGEVGPMHGEGLAEQLFHGEPWIEGVPWILKDHLDALADGEELPWGEGGDVAALEEDAAGEGAEQADKGFGEGAFPGAALPDEGGGLARIKVERQVMDDRPGVWVGQAEIADLQERRRGSDWRGRRGGDGLDHAGKGRQGRGGRKSEGGGAGRFGEAIRRLDPLRPLENLAPDSLHRLDLRVPSNAAMQRPPHHNPLSCPHRADSHATNRVMLKMRFGIADPEQGIKPETPALTKLTCKVTSAVDEGSPVFQEGRWHQSG